MKKIALLIICFLLVSLTGCASELTTGEIPHLPWPSHAPGAEPYIRAAKAPALPEQKQEVYETWEELLASMYVAENNLWFKDWELEMFKALPQDEPYDFTVHLATSVHHDNYEVMDTAKEFDTLGIKTEVWAIVSIVDGAEEYYYVCFIRCTPDELWKLSQKTQELYYIEQKYETVAQRCDVRIFPAEGEPQNG